MTDFYRSKLKQLLVVGVALFLFSCGNSQQKEQQETSSVEAYPVLELEPRTIKLTSSYPATLEGVQTVEIRPRLQGYIVEMPVDEGDVVEKGELLFQLNSEQYEQEVRSAEADVEAARAEVSTAEDEVKRLRGLAEQDIISDYRLQSARNTLESAKARLAQAEARLKNARVNLGYTQIKSPTDGVIGNIPYRIGSLVSNTTTRPLTVVSDISRIYAYFSMSEQELLEMARDVAGNGGDKTLQECIAEMPKVNLILPGNIEYGHRGTLRLASGLINTQTGSASCRAIFPNPREILRSGGSASVQIPFKQDSAIAVPKKATYEIQNKRFVYTVTDSNTVESTEIKTNSLSTEKLYVVEQGLSANSRIVTQGMGNLQKGQSIRPQKVNADSLYEVLTARDQPESTL